MSLIRKMLLGVVMAAGAVSVVATSAQEVRADFGDRFAYGHAFGTKRDAQAYIVNHPRSTSGERCFAKYCNVGPNGSGWYVCY